MSREEVSPVSPNQESGKDQQEKGLDVFEC